MPSLTAEEQAAARERLGQEAINRERERRLVNLEYAARGYLYREETDAELAYEKTVPDDVTPWITLDRIGGRTLVWNQGVRETANASGVQGNVVNNSTIYYAPSSEEYTTPMIAGHVYFCCARVEVDTDYILKESDQYGAFGVGFGDRYYTTDVTQHIPCASDHVGTLMFTATTSQTEKYNSPRVFLRLWTLLDTTAAAGTYINLSMTQQMVIDLTVMFGAGNEPSTAAEFRAMFPDAYYPYAEPMLMNMTPTQVKGVGKNICSPHCHRGQYMNRSAVGFIRVERNTEYFISCSEYAVVPMFSVHGCDKDIVTDAPEPYELWTAGAQIVGNTNCFNSGRYDYICYRVWATNAE